MLDKFPPILPAVELQQRRKGAALPNTARQTETGGDEIVNLNGTLDAGVKKIDPAYERETEAHADQGVAKETPIGAIERFVLVQGQDGNGGPTSRSEVRYIP